MFKIYFNDVEVSREILHKILNILHELKTKNLKNKIINN